MKPFKFKNYSSRYITSKSSGVVIDTASDNNVLGMETITIIERVTKEYAYTDNL